MRCAHPDEFVPQWPSDNNSVNHVRRKGQSGANSNPSRCIALGSDRFRSRHGRAEGEAGSAPEGLGL